MHLVPRPTEVIARECLFGADGNEGLALQLFELTAPRNDNKVAPWQQAELVLKEMLHVVTTMQQVIQARELRPAVHAAFEQVAQ